MSSERGGGDGRVRRRFGERAIDILLPGHAGSTQYPALDTIRAVAVIFVLVNHVWAVRGTPYVYINGFGHVVNGRRILWGTATGVEIFFVLSGFLLSMRWFDAQRTGRPAPRYRDYITRRLTRIVPP
ncbi:MAG: acyltransferase, partial [Pseudonocardia sp.]|nr:acyltransferase [Pseudonocardia sp.]